jgi:tRNA A37 threonylcarbamoyladenosine synthetase subunit TsaC/SUA5/YrdC
MCGSYNWLEKVGAWSFFELTKLHFSLSYHGSWSNVTIDEQSLSALLPGPVTLIFDRLPTLPVDLNAGNPTIGIRIPDYKFMIELAKYCDEPIALTSANISNEQSSLNINVSLSNRLWSTICQFIIWNLISKEFQSLWADLDLIVDGGTLGTTDDAKAGSTVIDFTKEKTFKIVRNGTHYEKVLKILVETCRLVRRYEWFFRFIVTIALEPCLFFETHIL